jgi:hypothetical protein
MLLRETCLPILSDDLQLVLDEIVSITLSGGTKRYISAFCGASSLKLHCFHLRTAAKIEAAIDHVATRLADLYVVLTIVTIGG